MRLSDLYALIVKFGNQCDPRPRTFAHTYEDSAILYGNPHIMVRSIMVGIDIEVSELLLAQRLRESKELDVVVSHHPHGKALAGLERVMQLQVDVLARAGVKRSLAQRLLDDRKREVQRRILPGNLTRTVDAARLLDMPFMCVHTPADNHVFAFVRALMQAKKPKTVKEIVEILLAVPEYRLAQDLSVGPRVILGNPRRPVGKILVDMTGGTEGSRDVFGRLRDAGVRTIIAMHLSEEHFKKVKDANLNVVIAGHISSDTLGLNLLLDKIERHNKSTLTTITCSGFSRIRREQ